MAETTFNQLANGDKFLYQNQVWVKVKSRKKSCCTKTANGQVLGNPKKTKTFRKEVVTKVEDEEAQE